MNGGIYSSDGDVNVWSSVVWGNKHDSIYYGEIGAQITLVGGCEMDVAFSTIEGGWAKVRMTESDVFMWGEGNSVLAPLFADADGPDDDPNTWVDNDYHLTAASPCVDAGDPNDAAALDETDVEGLLRVWTPMTRTWG